MNGNQPIQQTPAPDSGDGKRHRRYWHALSEISGFPLPSLDHPDVAFERIARVAEKAIQADLANVFRYAADGMSLECLTSREHQNALIAVLRGLDVQGIGSLAPDNGLLVVPVKVAGTVQLIFTLERKEKVRPWDAEEIDFATSVGGHLRRLEKALIHEVKIQEMQDHLRRFKSVAAASSDSIWDWDLVTDHFWWSDGFARLFGWSGENHASSINAWIQQIHPADRERVVAGIYQSIESGASIWSDEYRFLSYNGKISHVQDRGEILRDEQGKGIRMVGGMTDITSQKKSQQELARTHRALQMLSTCNETLVRATDENDLLAEVCRHGVEIGGYRMVWVGYAQHDENKSIKRMAHAGHEDGYLSEISLSWDENQLIGQGPVGRSLWSGKVGLCEDILEKNGDFYWREQAEKRGYRSVISLPLILEGESFGFLALYGAEPHPVGDEETKLLQSLADDLASGIGSIRNRQRSQRMQEVVIKVAQAVSTGTGEEFFDLLAQNMVEALGGTGGVVGRLNPVDSTIVSLSYVMDGKVQESITYGLSGTPCQKVLNENACVFPRNVQQLFPEDHFLVVAGIEAYAGIALRDQSGEVTGVMAVLFDRPVEDVMLVESTMRIFAARAAGELDRQQADSRIRDQASLLDKAQDAILVRQLDHTITYWNKSAERLYGWTAEEVIGQKVDELLYEEPSAFYQATNKTLSSGEWIGEIQQVDRHGRELIVEGRWNLVCDENGQPKSIFVINTDMTEHRRLEQQFIRAQRLESIGTMAGGLAHDLNNILAPISMAIELLKIRTHDERGQELLDTIAGSVRRGADMIEQVISFARGREGRRMDVNPRVLISEIAKIGRETFLKDIHLEIHASPDLWMVRGDPTQLHQVLLNLCFNARDAVSANGWIAIEATNVHIDESFAAMTLEAQPGPHVCITVKDNGTGIEQEIQEKIFDPFFTTKAVGKGTGLGLSSSLAIVKSHGGFIRVKSKPGLSTCFSVYLPARPSAVEGGEIPAPNNISHGNGEWILLIDDEESIRRVTCQTLEAYGYQVVMAESGDEAISIYARMKDEIAIVITDMMMPGMSGAATIEGLMNLNPQVQIIAVSGVAANGELATAAGAGVKHFLAKPFRAETLLNVLTNVLKREI